MQKKNIYFIVIIILVVIVLGGVYVILHVTKPNTAANNYSGADTILLTTHGGLYILTDDKGVTLYHDIQDWPTSTKAPYKPYTKCTGACSDTWPAFYAENIKVSPPLKAGDFMMFTRPDGKKQIAYRGWPLYYYTGDIKPGDTNGQEIGNIWYAGISPN